MKNTTSALGPRPFNLAMQPCPFCGSEDVEAKHDLHVVDGEEYASVYCHGCHAVVQGIGFGPTPEQAVFDAKCKWNQRALPEALMRRAADKDFDTAVYECTNCGCQVEWHPAWQHCPVCGAIVNGTC